VETLSSCFTGGIVSQRAVSWKEELMEHGIFGDIETGYF
jgi:hypothetical protein